LKESASLPLALCTAQPATKSVDLAIGTIAVASVVQMAHLDCVVFLMHAMQRKSQNADQIVARSLHDRRANAEVAQTYKMIPSLSGQYDYFSERAKFVN